MPVPDEFAEDEIITKVKKYSAIAAAEKTVINVVPTVTETLRLPENTVTSPTNAAAA